MHPRPLHALSAAVAARFARYVPPGAVTACWEWAGAHPKGYGTFTLYRRSVKAHRVAYALAHGGVPALCVLHSCDNPPCVNPAHLFLGTHGDNVKDRVTKGRSASGARNGKNTHPEKIARGDLHWTHQQPQRIARGARTAAAKLTPEQACEVYARAQKGESPTILSRAFGISRAAIRKIRDGRTWTVATGATKTK